MNEEYLNRLALCKTNDISCVVVTIVNFKGSIPQEVGARIIVDSHGLIFGTVGGGKVEIKTIEVAKKLLTSEDNYLFAEWNLQTDVGMTCGGVVGLFFEKILSSSAFKVAIFGAGHVSQELVRLLAKVDCHLTCIDPRLEWLEKLPEHFRLKKIQTEDMKSVLKLLYPKTFIVSVTMGHAFDLPILELALKNFDFPFVGVIGSESKKNVLLKNLENLQVPSEKLKKLLCPIGEKFGNNTPFEIALSIVAQLIKERDIFLLKK